MDEDLDGAPLDDLDGVPIVAAPVAAAAAWTSVAAPAPPVMAPVSFALGSATAAAPAVPPSVSAAKLAIFDTGASSTAAQARQTPYAKRVAEAEARRKKAEEEAASVYASFVQSFDTGASDSAATSSAGGATGASIARRGVPAGRGSSSLLQPKAFVRGGVMGGDMPASSSSAAASSTSAIAAPALPSGGGPPVTPGAKPMDPATLRAGLPSTSAPPKANPFSFSSSPAFAPSSAPAAASSGLAAAFSLDADAAADIPSAAKRRKLEPKKRNIDVFLEELKQNEQDKAAGIAPRSDRSDRSSMGGGGGAGANAPLDLGDPTSTNLYVGSLPGDVTEKRICELFAPYGDIASVKIMYPRAGDPEESAGGSGGRKKTLVGFVSFMRRDDAEQALKNMHNRMIEPEGNLLRLNWSRALPIPAQPLVLKTSTKDARLGKLKYPGDSAPAGPSAAELSLPLDAVKYQVLFPSDPELRAVIDLLAERVAMEEGGVAMEQALTQRASVAAPGTPDALLSFLVHPTSLENLYFRWRCYAFAQGDSLRHWRTRPFQMLAGGPWIIPPDCEREEREREDRRRAREELREKKREAERERERTERRKAERAASGKQANWDKASDGSTDGGRGGERTDRGKLSEASQATLMELLRHVTMEKPLIRDVMGWCLDHSDASKDIVELIAESLTLDQTPLPKKIARLYVVSDILYNSSAPIPNASSYRSLFQSHLVSVFSSVHRAHVRVARENGRMSADAIRNKIQLLFRAWNQWALFPTPFLQKLEHIFQKGDEEANAAAGTAGTPPVAAVAAS